MALIRNPSRCKLATALEDLFVESVALLDGLHDRDGDAGSSHVCEWASGFEGEGEKKKWRGDRRCEGCRRRGVLLYPAEHQFHLSRRRWRDWEGAGDLVSANVGDAEIDVLHRGLALEVEEAEGVAARAVDERLLARCELLLVDGEGGEDRVCLGASAHILWHEGQRI